MKKELKFKVMTKDGKWRTIDVRKCLYEYFMECSKYRTIYKPVIELKKRR